MKKNIYIYKTKKRKTLSRFSTELRPLIEVRNWFSISIFDIPLPIFFKLSMKVDIVKECSGMADG